jgi:3-phytase
MVVDDASRNLYVAQEDIGIWRVPVPFGRGAPVLVDRTKGSGVPATYDEATEECVPSGPDPGFGGRHLTADVEGLEIVPRRGKAPLLVASSQGDNTFATYERDGTRYRGGFAVVDGAVDGSSDCDGLAISPVPLGARYPDGPAVVQDGDDTPAGESSNVTFVRWDTIARGLRL